MAPIKPVFAEPRFHTSTMSVIIFGLVVGLTAWAGIFFTRGAEQREQRKPAIECACTHVAQHHLRRSPSRAQYYFNNIEINFLSKDAFVQSVAASDRARASSSQIIVNTFLVMTFASSMSRSSRARESSS